MLDHFTDLVIVTGCQRSGTTLLGQVLGAHPNAFLIDETDQFYEWFHACARGDSEANSLWDPMIGRARNKYHDISEKIRNKNSDKPYEFCDSVTHLVLQAPNLLYSFDLIQNIKTPVKIIYPVRDPRAVVASMSKLSHVPMIDNQLSLIRSTAGMENELHEFIAKLVDEDLPDHVKRAHMWRMKSTLQHKFIQRGIPVLSFRYEDFVQEAASNCKRITQYLQLEYHPVMLEHPSVFDGFGPGRTERRRPIDLNSRAIWSDRLDFIQEQEVLQVTTEEMSALGYDAIADF